MRTADSLALVLILTLCGLVASVAVTRTADHTRELATLRARIAKLEADAAHAQRAKLAALAWPDAPLVLPVNP